MSARKTLPNTSPLKMEGDLAAEMVAGIDHYLSRETEEAKRHRPRSFSAQDQDAFRKRLARILGVIDPSESTDIEIVAPVDASPEVATGPGYRIFETRWPVLSGVEGEGLLLQPNGSPITTVIALPDCDLTPEQFVGLQPGLPEAAQVPRRIAESGCRVLVPLASRCQDDQSAPSRIHLSIGL